MTKSQQLLFPCGVPQTTDLCCVYIFLSDNSSLLATGNTVKSTTRMEDMTIKKTRSRSTSLVVSARHQISQERFRMSGLRALRPMVLRMSLIHGALCFTRVTVASFTTPKPSSTMETNKAHIFAMMKARSLPLKKFKMPCLEQKQRRL